MKPFPPETAAWIRANAWTNLERSLHDSGLDWVYSKCMCEIVGDCLPCKRGDHTHCADRPRGAGHLVLFARSGEGVIGDFDLHEVGHPHRCPCHTAAHRGWVHPPEQGDLLELLGANG